MPVPPIGGFQYGSQSPIESGRSPSKPSGFSARLGRVLPLTVELVEAG